MIAADAEVARFEEISSTSTEARRRAEAGEAGPLWIVARRQTAGRGRRGRVWATTEGALACTYLGRTHARPADLALLGFAAAVALADTFEAFAPRAAVALKWPNDVLIGGEKAAGLLLESGAHGLGGLWFALGIGVNVSAHPPDAAYPATNLAAAGVSIDAEGVFAALRPRLAREAGLLVTEGFAPVRAAWLRRGPPLGAPIVVSLGEERHEGRFEGLAETGALLLRLPSGEIRSFSAGEVLSPLHA